MLKFFAGLVILFIALALQFWFAAAGIYLTLSFATLISFAFIFEFWELLIFVLVGTFIINWQPTASLEIVVIALFPILMNLSRNAFRWRFWVGAPIAIVFGFLLLYTLAGQVPLFSYWQQFLRDLAAGLAFGALTFFPLYRKENE